MKFETINTNESSTQLERKELLIRYKQVRQFTLELCKPLITEDYVIQSMPDVSPTKWHIAHVSWFFEAFILRKAVNKYVSINEKYNYIFNSYYVLIGARFTRADRGLLSRPSVEEIIKYRKFIDEQIVDLFENCDDETFIKFAPLVEVGLNHEQQHQELLLTDIKHVFSINPLEPVYSTKEIPKTEDNNLNWITFKEGLYKIGNDGKKFCYDNETPIHKEFLQSFSLASRLVTNGEYLEFIESNGYKKQELWLSDGWVFIETSKIKAPLYWLKEEGKWWSFTLNGYRQIELNEPVCHLSYYEAEAYAGWAGARLPSEAELEIVSKDIIIEGNFVEQNYFHPIGAVQNKKHEIQQIYGDVWEWTKSAYLPYPGFKALPGALGEYNGKFMSGQMVLRGGSCATSKSHIRKTYRNFFPPNARWQFSGFRLAKDIK